MSEFRLLDRGARNTILLIPGWAFDYRIFSSLDLRSNYLLPVEYSPFDFAESLLAAMRKNSLKKISILGWSMGSFLAFDLLSKHQDKVDDAIFVSVRRRYEKEKIENIEASLKKNRRAFLFKFYNDCFSGDERKASDWFRRSLLKSYLNQMDLNLLLNGLDYLLGSEFDPRILSDVSSARMHNGETKIKIIHGINDRVARLDEALELKNDMPHVEFIVIEETGHLPFLNPNFKRIFNDRSLP